LTIKAEDEGLLIKLTPV